MHAVVRYREGVVELSIKPSLSATDQSFACFCSNIQVGGPVHDHFAVVEI